jgi:hypothetical protein
MLHSDSRRIGLGRRTTVVATTMLCAAVAATAASAATLHIKTPGHVLKGKSYEIELTGTFKKSEVKRRAYLVSAIQYSSKPCAATAQAEANRSVQFYFLPSPSSQKVGIFESKSPFTRIDGFTARVLGKRRVCAYLYPKILSSPMDPTLPIARAQSRTYSVTKK